MIVRDRPSALKLFLIVRGSILPRIRITLIANTVFAALVAWYHGTMFDHKVILTTIPFTLIGLPLAIFLGFRNTAAYDRYWEGRKLWGELVLRSRNLSRQCQTMISSDMPARASLGLADVRVRMVCRTIAFCHALRQQLRDQREPADLQALLLPAEWSAACKVSNPSDYLMQQMGHDLADCLREGRIDSILAAQLDNSISAMVGAGASCERIRNTPIPFSYSLLLHRTAYIYCFLLPFGLVDSIGFMTPFVVAIVAYTFFGLDALGDEIEEPFGEDANDLPLTAMCRAIEINLRESLQDDNLPPPLKPHDYMLT